MHLLSFLYFDTLYELKKGEKSELYFKFQIATRNDAGNELPHILYWLNVVKNVALFVALFYCHIFCTNDFSHLKTEDISHFLLKPNSLQLYLFLIHSPNMSSKNQN